MVRVSEETQKILEGYKEEFGLKSLDESIVNAVQWARAFYCVDVLKRKELVQRVSDLEFRIEAIEKHQ